MSVEASGERQAWDQTIKECYHIETVLGDEAGNQGGEEEWVGEQGVRHTTGCMLTLGALGLLCGVKRTLAFPVPSGGLV